MYFPHLEDTVEVLQVDRVLARMNEFLRLMHEGLVVRTANERSIDTTKEIARGRELVEPIRERLKTAFPVRPEYIEGDNRPLAVTAAHADALRTRFAHLALCPLPGLTIEWEPQAKPGVLHGTARLGSHNKALTLLLRSLGARPSVRCISPVGCMRPGAQQDRIVASAARSAARIGAILTAESRTYDLTVEEEMLLAPDDRDDAVRVAALVQRVVALADTLELEHLPGRDEVLATLQAELDRRRMGGDWRRLCKATGLAVDGDHVAVALDDGRRHRVAVSEKSDGYRLAAIVAGPAVLSRVPDATIRIWVRNREARLVGFRIDRRGRLAAEAWVPKAGLSTEEFRLYLSAVAVEADRFEFALTGRDAE